MATRTLPGAYVSLQDNSQLPEGQTSLTVGYVLKANRGPVNEPTLVTSPTDFLTKYTFSGKPAISDDPTFWSILKVLNQTNMVYVSRAANTPLYGGATFKKATSTLVGTLTSATKNTKTIVLSGTVSPAVDSKIIIRGTGKIDGQYTVATVSASSGTVTVTVIEDITEDYTTPSGTEINVYSSPVVPLAISYETPALAKDALTSADAFMVIGKDPGAYNGKIAFGIISAVDRPNDLVYVNGANVGLDTTCTFNTMQLTVINSETKETLETFLFSLDPMAKTIDGVSLYVDNVVAGSAYIQVLHDEEDTSYALPSSTANNTPIVGGAGSDGSEVTTDTLIAALQPFADKTVNVSILGNGCSAQAESQTFQQALMEVADTRKDLIVFLNDRYSEDETATIPSTRATNIVNYKKNTLANVSFYGTMYAPHGKTSDTYNGRQVRIGMDGVAIAGWLGIINTLNYPYAYAGPRNGQVSGVTFDWKIGDASGEAQLMNDASINYVAFDSKVGRYYMQCQNTLQVANSTMRNLGAVFNVLDIKEHFVVSLKEYLQLPITASLRRDIVNTAVDYLDPMVGVRFNNYAFNDITTDTDIANNTLRYLLIISPANYAQNIYLFMNIVNANYDFAIMQSM